MSRQDHRRTSTVAADGTLVPWLAADGPLAFRPESPPATDKFFQYGRILPEILADQTDRKRQYWFGAMYKDDAREVLAFWARCRSDPAGAGRLAAAGVGLVAPEMVHAPLVVYDTRDACEKPRFVFMQHGSYLLVPVEDQPLLGDGQVLLYRGIMDAQHFKMPRFERSSPARRSVWLRYLGLQAHVLSDSVLSFNTIHDRAVRTETMHIRDRSFLSDELAERRGLMIKREGLARQLWDATRQSFALCRWVAQSKFGPNFVVARTPLDNIRITTFFAQEYEARSIDPERVELLEAHGCEVDVGGAR